jgi:hypothetical protein
MRVKTLRVAMRAKRRYVRGKSIPAAEAAATKRFKALMKKHAGRHHFNGLDEP